VEVRTRRIAFLLCLLAGVTALTVLLDWHWRIGAPASRWGLPTMKPNTAVGIALLALANAVTLRSGERIPTPLRLLGAAVSVLGIVTAAQDLLQGSWGVDSWFVPTSAATAQRMSPATATVIASLGAGVACGVGSPAARKARDGFTLLGGSIATLAVLDLRRFAEQETESSHGGGERATAAS